MKRRLVFLVVLVMTVLACVPALAARPSITEQPESQSVKIGESVSFTIKAKGYSGLTWYFIDPVTSEEISARKIDEKFTGLKVIKPNGTKMTLKNVPAEINGWSLYVHLSGNGYTLDSDIVLLHVEGAANAALAGSADAATESQPEGASESASSEASAEANAEPAPAEAAAEPAPADNSEPAPADGQEMFVVQDGSAGETAEAADTADASLAADDPSAAASEAKAEATEAPQSFTVKVKKGLELYRLKKNAPTGKAKSKLTFKTETGAFFIKSAGDPFSYLTLNDITFTFEAPISGITVHGISEDTVISTSKPKKTTSAASSKESEAEDSAFLVTPTQEPEITLAPTPEPTATPEIPTGDNLVSVTCENCRFSGGGYTFATSGQVPAGTTITVAVGSSGDPSKGYSINGSEAQYLGKTSFRLEVSADTAIAASSR